MKIRMDGKKLKGEFALVRTKGRGENSWLLIKHRDKFATDKDITEKDRSVRSRKTIAGMAKDKKARQWGSDRKSTTPVKKAAKTERSGRRLKAKAEKDVPG